MIQKLVEAFQGLPGVGPRSALRMVMRLLEDRHRRVGLRLAQTLTEAMERVVPCQICRNWTEGACCTICADVARDPYRICVIETPSELLAFERAGVYRGRYYVLGGRLSPIDGRGPDTLGIPALCQRVVQDGIREVILAISTTVEGEATTLYLADALAHTSALVTCIAQGVPMGGELEFVDGGTLTRALMQRQPMGVEKVQY